MKYYRCYLLAADGHIATAEILKCADDSDAERQCLDVFGGTRCYASAEVWDGARQVYRHPEPLAGSERGDEADASDEQWTIADALDAQIADDCRTILEADGVKAAHRRERRLERAATTMPSGEKWKFDRRH
jgi:hypothetical protein